MFLVGVLITLVFATPKTEDAAAAVAASKTLAISVIAFYFGLHKGTPHRSSAPNGGIRPSPTKGARDER